MALEIIAMKLKITIFYIYPAKLAVLLGRGHGGERERAANKMLADSGLWRLFKTSREIEQATATTLVSGAYACLMGEIGDCQ